MKPYSKYVFEQSNTSKSSYILKEIHGFVFPDFPATYKRGDRKGLQYITYADPKEELRDRYDKSLYYGDKTLENLKFTELAPERSFGDNKKNMGFNDCLLVEFSDNSKVLTLYFLKDMANQKKLMFDKWLNGEVLEAVDSELLPLNEKAASREN